MLIFEIRNAIIEGLKKAVTGVAVEIAPDDPQSYSLKHPKGAILVDYDYSNASEPSGSSQALLHSFNAIVCLRNLAQSNEGLEIIEKVKTAITALDFGARRSFYCSRIAQLGFEQGVLYYELNFVLPDYWDTWE